MSTINTLSDIFSQTSSLLNGLLSQMGTNGTNNDLFSSLLTQDSANLSAPPTPSPTVNVVSSYATSSIAPSGIDLLQALQNISTTLQNLLTLLPHPNTATTPSNAPQNTAQSNSSAQQTPQSPSVSQTQDNTPANPTPSAGSNNQSATDSNTNKDANGESVTAATSDSTSSSPPTTADLQSLAAVVAQILVLFQVMMQNLQHPKVADASTNNAAALSGIATTNSPDEAASSSTDTAQTSKTLQSIESLLDTLNNPSTPTGTQNASTATASPADALAQILTDLQKMTSSLLPANTTSADQQAASQSTSTAQQDSTSADILGTIAVQVAQFDEKLNHIISLMQQKSKAASALSSTTNTTPNLTTTPAAALLSATTAQKNVTPSLKLPQENLPPASTPAQQTTTSQQQSSTQQSSSPPAKQDLSGTWQSQAFSFQNTTSPSNTQPTAAQIFTNSAALVAAAEHNSGSTSSDAGSDFLSNGQNSSPQITVGTSSALSAEGTQAAGTYNFASTLSALRATNGGSIGLPSVIDQVILQMNRNVKSGNDQMTLQMNPADLGKITIKLDFGSDNKVQGTVTADNPQTLSLIQKDSRSLERALQDAGLRADPGSLQFNLGSQTGNGAGNNAGQTANSGNNTNNNAGNGTQSASDTTGLVDIGTIAETYYITPNGVNIQV